MPNYVETSISFEGDENQIKELFEKVKVDELGLGTIDFSKVIPMPEDVVIECGSRTDKGLKAYYEFIKQYSNGKEVDLTSFSTEKEDAFFKSRDDIDKEEWKLGKQAFNNIQKYGVPTWYEWSINNWGTKWNSCGYVEGTDYSQCDKLQFQTAWSPALRVVQKLSQMYPNLKMTVQWADEDFGRNCGELTFKNGAIILVERTTRISNLAQRYEGGKEYPELFISNYDTCEFQNSCVQMSLFKNLTEEMLGERGIIYERLNEINSGTD